MDSDKQKDNGSKADSKKTFGFPISILKKLAGSWDHFFHRKADLSVFGAIRIGFAFLLLLNVLFWLPNVEKWFSETGVMTLEVSKMVVDEDTISIFEWLPKTSAVVWSCYLLLVANVICLLFGFLTRIQLVCIFVLFTSFCHRNNMLFDGEDVLFRMFTFYLFFSPAGKFRSVDNWIRQRRNTSALPNGDSPENIPSTPKLFPIWPLRLIQIQTSCVLFCSGIEKLRGDAWRDGTALYYVSRLDDLFYRFPVPDFLFNSLTMVAVATWSAILLELTIPILVWFKKTRLFALAVALVFHLSLDYMMNLNMFQWLMIVGWISFLRPEQAGSWLKIFQSKDSFKLASEKSKRA